MTLDRYRQIRPLEADWLTQHPDDPLAVELTPAAEHYGFLPDTAEDRIHDRMRQHHEDAPAVPPVALR